MTPEGPEPWELGPQRQGRHSRPAQPRQRNPQRPYQQRLHPPSHCADAAVRHTHKDCDVCRTAGRHQQARKRHLPLLAALAGGRSIGPGVIRRSDEPLSVAQPCSARRGRSRPGRPRAATPVPFWS